MNSIYAIALTAATLIASPIVTSESIGMGNVYADVNNYMTSLESTTSNQIADSRRYLNSIMIRESFRERLEEKKLYEKISDSVKNFFYKINDKCSYFNLKEVYADYSLVTNAIRIDMIIDNDFLLIVRKTIEKEADNNIAVSLSKGNETYLVDCIDLDNLTKEVNYCIKG